MAKLYELTADIMQLQDMLENEVEDEQVLLDTLEGVQWEYDFKLEQCAKAVRTLEADMEAIKNEVDRLNNKRKLLNNNIDRLKKYMFDSMKATDTTKVKGTVLTVAIQKNWGKLPVVVYVDTSELPDDLVKIVESPDLDAIRKELDAGNCEYAHYGERGESLRIK